MKILILGGFGMLGHKLLQVARERFDTFATIRAGIDQNEFAIDKTKIIENVTADNLSGAIRALDIVRPATVVNCIGIVKQRPEAADAIQSITVNALFPHQMARLCQERNVRLIHLSTDCVFSGIRGNYTEADPADPMELYGRTKLLGEVAGENCLTIRTSMVGRELGRSYGLIEWFLMQRGKSVSGFRRAKFSGLTTIALSHIICDVIERCPQLQGLYHVASEPISKLELLRLIDEILGLSITIKTDDTLVIDRSLNADRFREATGLISPTWRRMIQDLADDAAVYRDRV